jgi:hypothetical protein
MREYTWTRRTSDEYEAEHGGETARQLVRQANGCTIVAIGPLTGNQARSINVNAVGMVCAYPTAPIGTDPDAYADAYALHLAGFAACVSAAVMTDLLAAPDPEGLEVAIADLGLSVTHFEG